MVSLICANKDCPNRTTHPEVTRIIDNARETSFYVCVDCRKGTEENKLFLCHGCDTFMLGRRFFGHFGIKSLCYECFNLRDLFECFLPPVEMCTWRENYLNQSEEENPVPSMEKKEEEIWNAYLDAFQFGTENVLSFLDKTFGPWSSRRTVEKYILGILESYAKKRNEKSLLNHEYFVSLRVKLIRSFLPLLDKDETRALVLRMTRPLSDDDRIQFQMIKSHQQHLFLQWLVDSYQQP